MKKFEKPPTNWIDLPVELKKNVTGFLDFLSLNRLSRCSKSNFTLAKSQKINIDFLKIFIFETGFEISIFQGKTENPIEICGISIGNDYYLTRNFTIIAKQFKSIDEFLSNFSAIFRENLKIRVMCFEIQKASDSEIPKKILDFMSKIQSNFPEKSIISGLKNLKKINNFQKSINSEILMRNWSADISRPWAEWKAAGGVRYYTVTRWKVGGVDHEFIRAAVSTSFALLVALFVQNTPNCVYWITDFHLEDPENQLVSYPGVFERFPNFSVKKIPINAEKVCFIKFQKCGIFMEISAPDTQMDETCNLEFSCPEHSEKSAENQHFYRKIEQLL